ncbi:NAD(P)-dependent oxidoreductase [Solicola gregarius]|uniref:NAD(P)-dependent oxidoreductase n=1 Tax=Solicola gregarius TaxID=2908642 RepID=A0AA46TG03_9ACTN|nr:NAD(P)-dependent oxidoreductase [Solicola gregarius]UYM04672.1 NAD(P)-dependent oxidoreductase [Solicola gregarius]
MSADVSVLGLGTMGGRVAARAAEVGLDVVGYDPDPAARERAAAAGVTIAGSAEACAGAAPLVIVSVPNPEHVTQLATGALQHCAAGTTVADLSTIDPTTARDAAASLAPRDVAYLDSPVLGRPDKVGNWTLVVGGEADAITRFTPTLLQVAAAKVVRVGDTGAGSVVKVLNNLMFGAINAVTAEAVALCRDNGVDPGVFVDTVADSGAATVSNLFRELAPRIVSGDDDPVFALDLLAKDNRLATELAKASGSRAPIAETVSALNVEAVRLGFGARDSGAVYRAYDGERA